MQPAHGRTALRRGACEAPVDEDAELGRGGAQRRVSSGGLRRWRLMPRCSTCARRQWLRPRCPVLEPRVLATRRWPSKTRARSLRLAHLDAPADELCRDRVAVGVQVDEALESTMRCAARRPRARAAAAARSRGLGREQIDGAGTNRTLEGLALTSVAPGDELCIEVVEVGEVAARIEVALDVVERPLDASGAVGVTELVRLELEAEALRRTPPSPAPAPCRRPCRRRR